MSVLRKICGITRRDRRRNSDVMKELDIEKDTVHVLQTRRLTYFGHVNRMHTQRYPYVLLHGHTHGHRPKGRPRKKWIDSIREDCADTRPLASLRTGHHGGTLFSIWAANARCHRYRHNGNKSSQVKCNKNASYRKLITCLLIKRCIESCLYKLFGQLTGMLFFYRFFRREILHCTVSVSLLYYVNRRINL